jgi:hypothetical protein
VGRLRRTSSWPPCSPLAHKWGQQKLPNTNNLKITQHGSGTIRSTLNPIRLLMLNKTQPKVAVGRPRHTSSWLPCSPLAHKWGQQKLPNTNNLKITQHGSGTIRSTLNPIRLLMLNKTQPKVAVGRPRHTSSWLPCSPLARKWGQ